MAIAAGSDPPGHDDGVSPATAASESPCRELRAQLVRAIAFLAELKSFGSVIMGLSKTSAFLAVLAAVPVLATWQVAPTRAQQVPASATRTELAVVESFDSKYLGDTPGHIAHGRIGKERPDVALGDPVYHGDRLIGKVTGVTWDRTRESLDVEFDPEPYELDEKGRPAAPNRVAVGIDVWIPMGGSKASAAAARDSAPRPKAR